MPKTFTEADYRNYAIKNATDDLEVDADAVVSMGDDEGAFVQGWIWVSNYDIDPDWEPDHTMEGNNA